MFIADTENGNSKYIITRELGEARVFDTHSQAKHYMKVLRKRKYLSIANAKICKTD